VTDAELVERARRGDRAAFDAIVERYQHVVFRTALAVTSNREEAEDAAQETFLRAFGHIGGFRGDSSLKTWLLAIAWREGISKRRSLVNRLRRMVSTPEDEAFDPPAAGRTEEARVKDAEHALTVLKLVARLPQSYREALMLAATGDFTFDEMSAALGVPVGTLKWRVSEARRQLREKLRALGYQG
jgi:RNA polymerase sigma-70 factor (ECF subfamily)